MADRVFVGKSLCAVEKKIGLNKAGKSIVVVARWVKLVGLAMSVPSQLTAWKQANFEIYQTDAKGQTQK